jgi:hypothetical protein
VRPSLPSMPVRSSLPRKKQTSLSSQH